MSKIASDFEIVVPDVDERRIENQILDEKKNDKLSQKDLAIVLTMRLALEKARAVQKMIGVLDDYVIIACDTSVAVEDEILGKPKDRDDAVRMLRKESESPQYVVTGVAFLSNHKEKNFCEVSKVIFHPLDAAQEERIQNYCDTDEPYDKAGAYGIQLHGDTLVERIEGDYDNIVGFPVAKIIAELERL